MGSIYIRSDNTYFELTTTTSIKIDKLSDITQHPMEFGSNVADNKVDRNNSYSLSGLISDIKSYITLPVASNSFGGFNSYRGQRSVPEFFIELDKLRNSNKLFEFHFDERISGAGISNCLIKRLSYSASVVQGGAYKVDMEIVETRLSERAERFEVKRQSSPNDTEDETSGGSQSTVDKPDENLGLSVVGLVTGAVTGG